MKPTQIKMIQARSKRLAVRIINPQYAGDPFVMIVGSRSNSTLNHIVTVKFERGGGINARCTCPWAEHGGMACSHVIAALSRLAARKHRALSFWLTPEDARRQKQMLFRLSSGPGENVWITSRRPAAHRAA
jgi:hypothetical protein